jgi:hypothetical protein
MISIGAEGIAVAMEPSRGGKITSLLDRSTGREWLEASAGPLEGPVDKGALFDEGDMCGWDEMMPTIEACRYPGTDIELADHGELWRTAWSVTTSDAASVTTLARDEVLGYSFERTLRVIGSTLRLDYRVVNEADVERALLWAAHPLFAQRPGTRVILDANEFDMGASQPGGPADPVGSWPVDGVCLGDLAPGQSQKRFARLKVAWASVSLIDDDGRYLTMRWDRHDAPFVGIWLDNCSLSRHPVVALEPTNCHDDALDVAIARGDLDEPWVIAPRGDRQWSLEVEVGVSPASG